MFNQKGQIIIIVLALVVVGFILYANFSGPSIGKWFSGYQISSGSKTSSGSTSKENKISAPTTKQIEEPTPTSASSPASSSPDIIPPKRLNPQPKDKSILPAETRQITLGLETNERATCRYSDAPGVYYNLMQGDFEQTDSTVHSVPITALNEGGKYKYYIRCRDEKGNANIDDFIISFEVKLPEDKTPPILSNPSHRGDVLPAGTKEAVISISTNEPASCRYSAKAGILYNSMEGRFSPYDQTKKFHTKNITGLTNGKDYDYFVRCQDLKNNSNTGDVLIRFSVGL